MTFFKLSKQDIWISITQIQNQIPKSCHPNTPLIRSSQARIFPHAPCSIGDSHFKTQYLFNVILIWWPIHDAPLTTLAPYSLCLSLQLNRYIVHSPFSFSGKKKVHKKLDQIYNKAIVPKFWGWLWIFNILFSFILFNILYST